MTHKRWICVFLSLVILALSASAGLTFLLDPLLQFHKESPLITYYEYDPVGMTRKFFADGKKLPPVFMMTGTDDHGYHRFNWYRELLESYGCDVTYDEVLGQGHNYRTANVAIETFIKWLPRTDYYATNKI